MVLDKYSDWKDISEWPKAPDEDKIRTRDKSGRKLMNPREMKGIAGAFNRVYDIHSAIENFLPHVYEPNERFTAYHHIGSTTGYSAHVYDNGLRLFSYHATDDAYWIPCDAFKLVQIHKFGNLDEGYWNGAEGAASKSYQAMKKFALEIPEVAREFKRMVLGTPKDDFGVPLETDNKDVEVQDDTEWVDKFEITTNGNLCKTSNNIMLILENDLRIKK